MITLTKEEAQQVLDAMTDWKISHREVTEAIETLRARLAQPEKEQEPVAWAHPDGRIWVYGRGYDKSTFTIPLYEAPPQREWIWLPESCFDGMTLQQVSAMKYAEYVLKEKNT